METRSRNQNRRSNWTDNRSMNSSAIQPPDQNRNSDEVSRLRSEITELRLQLLEAASISREPPRRRTGIPEGMSRNLEKPKLGHPEETTIEKFNSWNIAWANYKQLIDPLAEAGDNNWKCFLRMSLHEEWITLWDQHELDTTTDSSTEQVINAIKAYILKSSHPALNRHRFYSRHQMEGESVSHYLSSLRSLESACQFKYLQHCQGCSNQMCTGLQETLKEERLRDQMIEGINNDEARKAILRLEPDDFSFEKVKRICLSEETSKLSCEEMSKSGRVAEMQASENLALSQWQREQHSKEFLLELWQRSPSKGSVPSE